MKIAVYSICKNEIDQVDVYMDHLDALGLKPYVLDHSTDGTTEKLRARGALVDTTPVEPWWWDRGKNAALKLVDKEVSFVVNLDLDERLSSNFWQIVKQVKPDTKLVQHLYKPEGDKDRVRYSWRLHARHGMRWAGPVHEYLECTGEKQFQNIDELLITHWPPPNKNHVPVDSLLRAVKAFPKDVRIKALCGRELYFSGRIKEAAKLFRDFLRHDYDQKGDICYAHRMIAKCYKKMEQYDRALFHYKKAAAFNTREALIELAEYYYQCEAWALGYAAARQALEVTEGIYAPNSDPDCWTFKPHEMISIGLFYDGQYSIALLAAETALKMTTGKDAERISKHLDAIKAAMSEKATQKV